MPEFVKIWAFAIFAAILYGILHDQVTIRVCPEYFTVYHPDMGFSNDLTQLALGWGIFATWWMGAILGLPLTLVSRVGSLPKVTAMQLLKPMGVLLGVMAVSALIAGMHGYFHPDPAEDYVSPDKYARFSAAHSAHEASYFMGAWGGIVLCAWVWAMRHARGWMRLHNGA